MLDSSGDTIIPILSKPSLFLRNRCIVASVVSMHTEVEYILLKKSNPPMFSFQVSLKLSSLFTSRTKAHSIFSVSRAVYLYVLSVDRNVNITTTITTTAAAA